MGSLGFPKTAMHTLSTRESLSREGGQLCPLPRTLEPGCYDWIWAEKCVVSTTGTLMKGSQPWRGTG